MKESNQVEVAEFPSAQVISNDIHFKWWFPYTLRKRSGIIAAVSSHFVKQ